MLFRTVEIAVKNERLRCIRERLAAARDHSEGRVLFVGSPDLSKAFARVPATRVRQSAEPTAARLALRQRELVDERPHLIGDCTDTLRVAEANLDERVEPHRHHQRHRLCKPVD